MTHHSSLENEIVELSIQLVQAKYLVEEALIRQQWLRTVRALIKERRDSHADKSVIQNQE